MIVYGKQVFFYILQKHKDLINELYLAKECDKASFSQIAKSGFKIKRLDFKAAQALAKGGNHQGFLMDIKDFEFCKFSDLKKKKFLVMLYGITDVGNIGAIARTAYALGVDGLICVGKSLKMDAIIKASSGAALDIPISLVEDGLSALNELKQLDFFLYASLGGGKDVRLIKARDKKVLIMGSEGFGIPKKIIEKSDECIGIHMKNDFDSLNVSAAFAILCDRINNG
ncbi:23S rRNA (guanosine(2251)-2'-O)-methyltransferase RlmB [Campylobacter sp. MIT 99-7217]|uniref:TrmH family RNA methyltransferase n=1 Tax=Campylobacter sp. MIT 99-7217 TaxID=535091 RepID=UPI0011591822|nr:RNA methyltransferase [Campylobacter sp. MIT 99-7217]TQR31002.1 23S rRNA (guanosine(2251)-2'-O)-methyltransferase RlmB [Campylobacter sp. MIT 99-7217]